MAEIIMFGGNFAPRGWAFCDGQLLSINNYQALFSLLGTTFGGDGRTSFGLPELRGRTAIHPGTGPGLTNRRLGERSGQETVILNTNQIASHAHTFNPPANNTGNGTNGDEAVPTNGYPGPATTDFYFEATNTTMGQGTTNNAGGNQAHTNMQPFIGIYHIIALQGVFPSRN